MNAYFSMIPYVNPWSTTFGKPSTSPQQEQEELETEAIFHEIEIPKSYLRGVNVA